MNENHLLSIVIPTFKRAVFLDKCLALQIPVAREFSLAIYVSDNASDDDTKLVVEKRMTEYCHIKYFRNDENIGPDKNFEVALKIPSTNYIWLMGDTYHIPRDLIDYAIKKISNATNVFDCIVFNVGNRVHDTPCQEYTDKNKLLIDLGWHMTCMSTLVYSNNLISNANFKRYRETFFIQTGVIFEYIEDKEFSIYWNNLLSVKNIIIDGVKKKSWQRITFEVWVDKWVNFIFSLPPSYDINLKLECVKKHGVKSGLFTTNGLLLLRESGLLNYSFFKKYKNTYPLAINSNKIVILISCIMPIFIVSWMRLASNTLKKFFRLKIK